MPESADVLLKELGDFQLPALAFTKRRFQELMDRPHTSLGDLAAVLDEDPGLALRLLRELARSPRARDLDSVDPVWMMNLLGLSQVRALVEGTPALEERFREPALSGLRACYSRALHASRYAERLAALRGKLSTEEDALLALLQNLGEMVLWARRPGTMRDLGPQADGDRPEDLDRPIAKVFGISPGQLGETLASRWQLPAPFRRVQRFSNSLNPDVQLPLLAAALARAGMRDWQSNATLELLDLAAELTHSNIDLVRALIHKDTAEIARDLHPIGLPHCADRLLLPPGFRLPPLGSAPPVPAAAPARPAPAAPATPAKTNALQQNLNRIMHRMRDELGLRRIMFAMLTPDRQWIRARYILETERSNLNQFLVTALRPNLFRLLLDKPHALWVHGDNRPKYQPHISEAVAPLLNPDGFYLVTVIVKGKPIGLFYADGGSGVAQDEGQFNGFKRLCLEASILFEGG